MFEGVSSRLGGALERLRGKRSLNLRGVDDTLQDMQRALLEADVHFDVARRFLDDVRKRALADVEEGRIPGGLTAGQHLIRIVHEELTSLLGGKHQQLKIDGTPSVMMLVGLQGSGKTSTVGKLAHWLSAQGKTPYLIPADVYRPGAIEQLQTLARELKVEAYPAKAEDGALRIAKEGLAAARRQGADVALLDTAGRLAIDEKLMAELKQLRRLLKPQEVLFIADGMSGQDAVRTAQAFDQALELSGHILTKMDGDARGGAAFSIRAVTGKPIKCITLGEKLEQLELFRPERIASRILGMGDVLSLVERAQRTFDQQKALETQRKIQRNAFTLADFQEQLHLLRQMGSLEEMAEMAPALGKMMAGKTQEQAKELARMEAMIQSMTPYERQNHQKINVSRQRRIARGSGARPRDVVRLLKQFDQMRRMMRKFSRMGMQEAASQLLDPNAAEALRPAKRGGRASAR